MHDNNCGENDNCPWRNVIQKENRIGAWWKFGASCQDGHHWSEGGDRVGYENQECTFGAVEKELSLRPSSEEAGWKLERGIESQEFKLMLTDCRQYQGHRGT